MLPWFSLPMALGLLLLSLSAAPAIAVVFLFLLGLTAGWTVTVMGPFWAELYGVRYLGAIKALGSALAVFSSALSPFLLGWLIDAGVAIDALAQGSAVYVCLACLLAFLAFRGERVRPLRR